MQLELGGDQGGGELGVGCGASARAPDLRRDVVQLLAVLVGDDGTARGPGIGGDLVDLCVSVLNFVPFLSFFLPFLGF